MNWISDYVRPKFDFFSRRDMPENLWIKDPESGEMVFHKDLEANQWVVPSSGHHMYIPAAERLSHFYDDGAFEVLKQPEVAQDPLKFRDERRYIDKLKESRTKTKMDDTIMGAVGKLFGMEVTCAVHEYKFMGGSLGMAAGEAIVKAMEEAVKRKTPFIMYTASGGARMQEGILSLMQLPRTTVAVQMLREAGLPYIVVLTNPTTGGVSASYAMLGDIHIAEPGALICFAGPRVIEQTIREKLPEGFQRAEYLKEHGMVDMVVPRTQLRETIGDLLSLLTKQPKREEIEIVEEEASNEAPTVKAEGKPEKSASKAD
ncbi:acetyl-CoA carboxylase, carboxyltransferase subunit beta [Pseudahrensia aquimaris]|uniref:Acetyl-coenzyme A carboxylase carboxyl transferase subunit beta n=1 Tax=Pseudahrensia aquimaris TaxID=744461 RepID=A0ABW3FFR2_9HYPH